MGIFTRNWQIKIGAVALATVLYTGLVFSGSFADQVEPGVAVTPLNQPEGTILLSSLGTVDVGYRVATDSAGLVTSDSFAATVDLADYDMERPAEPQSLTLSVRSLVDGVNVRSWQPTQVTVLLDMIASREVPVVVERGDVPPGLEISRPATSVDSVTVRGPASLVTRVDRAVARVRIDPSGIDVDLPVDLVAVDIDGRPVPSVDVEPSTVTVSIDVQALETNKTVPVRPQVSGIPAAGFALEALVVEPSVVTLRGAPDALADVEEVLTEALSIADASADASFTAELELPPNTRLADAGAGGTVSVIVEIIPSVTSRTFVAGIVCTGTSEGAACLPALEQLSVTVGGPADVLSGLSAAEITPVLDVSGLGPGTHSIAPVLVGLPDGLDLVGISPQSVGVTIVPPATPTPTPTPTPAP